MLADIDLEKQKNLQKPAFTERKLNKLTSIPSLIVFTLKDFMLWWYIQMPSLQFATLGRVLKILNDQLSISLLIKNFFKPWRRDDSMIGFFIGIIVKGIYLPIALTIYLFTIISFLIFTLFWLILPVLTIFMILTSPILPLNPNNS